MVALMHRNTNWTTMRYLTKPNLTMTMKTPGGAKVFDTVGTVPATQQPLSRNNTNWRNRCNCIAPKNSSFGDPKMLITNESD